jgi:hypothetical protein
MSDLVRWRTLPPAFPAVAFARAVHAPVQPNVAAMAQNGENKED